MILKVFVNARPSAIVLTSFAEKASLDIYQKNFINFLQLLQLGNNKLVRLTLKNIYFWLLSLGPTHKQYTRIETGHTTLGNCSIRSAEH
jgi:hypothetical protein